jgi:conjugative transfer pilus assembly protein TraH
MRGKKILLLAIFLFTRTVFADVATDLSKTFDNLNMDSNISGPSAFKDQTGGYYTGGSVFARTPIKNARLANVQMPSFNAGCGGIDFYAGGISYLNAGEIVQNMKSAIPAAGGYAFAMAMQTYTPQLYNVMTELQDWAQKINSLNINSCETAALSVGGLWPKSDSASKYLCNTLGSSNGMVTDWVKGRHTCGDEDSRNNVNRAKNKDFMDQLGEEYNLVWKAIRKNDFLANDDQLPEFFMSVSGSIIKKKGERISKNLPSLAIKQDLVEMLVFGNIKNKTPTIYSCDERENCLSPSEKSFALKKQESLSHKVESLLTSMSNKIISDEEATPEEIGLVNSTNIPIMKILAIEAAYKRGGSPISVLEFTDAISYDLLLKYLEAILDLVSVSLKELQKVQVENETIDQFKTEIRDIRARILEKRNGIFQRMVTALDIIQKTKILEKELQNTFSEYSDLKK